jgi:glycosyltransferase involved in cell wall biosynthesis
MKILLVAQNYHPFVGGVETHARQVAHALHERHEVVVAAVNFSANTLPRRIAMLHSSVLVPRHDSRQDGRVPVRALGPSLVDRLRLLPIAARVVPGLSRLAGYFPLERFGFPWYRSVFLPQLQRLMRGVDVVHSLAGGYLGWTAQAAARCAGVPFVSTPFVHPRQWGDGPTDVAYYRRADAVIALVDTDRDYLLQVGVPADKIRVIGVSPELPPRSDPEGFRRRHGLGSAPVILYVGRMMPQKGARAVLEAAPLVWQRRPDARFVFVGPLSPGAEAWFQRRDPRVLVLGRVDLQQKADALAACDVFCMPSLSEILPTVYLEAWSYGKPVIGGRANGLPELVEGNGAGISVSQEPPAIAEALTRVLDDPGLRGRLGAAGRQLVEMRYSLAAVTGSLENLYLELAERRCRREPACPH